MSNTIIGSDGGETLNGTNGDDVIFGNGGNDVLRGNEGDDTLWGGLGVDTLFGGAGADILDGGFQTGSTVHVNEFDVDGDLLCGVDRTIIYVINGVAHMAEFGFEDANGNGVWLLDDGDGVTDFEARLVRETPDHELFGVFAVEQPVDPDPVETPGTGGDPDFIDIDIIGDGDNDIDIDIDGPVIDIDIDGPVDGDVDIDIDIDNGDGHDTPSGDDEIDSLESAWVELLYEAGLNRPAQGAGKAFWLDVFESFEDAEEGSNFLAYHFLYSLEFQENVGDVETMDSFHFVGALYENVLDREAKAGGLDFWAGVDERGDSSVETRVEILEAFAGSQENIAQADLAGEYTSGDFIWI